MSTRTRSKSHRREHGEGSITAYETAGGRRWRCQWWEPVDLSRPEAGKKQRSRGGFLTRDDARDELRANLARVAAGKAPATRDRLSFDAYARRWLAGYSCEPTTRVFITRVINAMEPYIGNLPLTQVFPSDLAAAYRGLEIGARARPAGKGGPRGPLAGSTVLRYSGWVITILNAAVAEGIIERNPGSHKNSGRPRGQRAKRVKPFQVWDPEQVAVFCEWALATDQPWAHAWSVLVRTGLRSGELLALRWSDIDLRTGSLLVERTLRYNETLPKGHRYELAPPKGGRPRNVALDQPTLELFAGWRRTLSTSTRTIRFSSGPVFPPIAGRSPTQSGLLAAFHRVQSSFAAAHTDIELPLISVHDLRHTHASLLLAAGVDVKVIQERLGHSSATITLNTYAHLMPNSQAAALERFEALLASRPPTTRGAAEPAAR